MFARRLEDKKVAEQTRQKLNSQHGRLVVDFMGRSRERNHHIWSKYEGDKVMDARPPSMAHPAQFNWSANGRHQNKMRGDPTPVRACGTVPRPRFWIRKRKSRSGSRVLPRDVASHHVVFSPATDPVPRRHLHRSSTTLARRMVYHGCRPLCFVMQLTGTIHQVPATTNGQEEVENEGEQEMEKGSTEK
ncbi:hypothetical protein BHE74_00019115 [Ensete ventricosum]|nr:hypothetical protein GW17_00032183 [Ensete ventricosum]RWW73032.1 hypothetical protein BHE74_00019115 [Ensete ventricosum]RZR81015.1 hypothetical protein BHM03_00007158 [Ensete ventricosum]